MIRIFVLFLLLCSDAFAYKSYELTPVTLLTIARMERDAGCKLHITSGYRSPEHNARVGGSKRSQHLEGTAIDFRFKCLSIRDGVKIAKKYCKGLGIYNRHIHCDMRKGHKAIWYGRSK